MDNLHVQYYFTICTLYISMALAGKWVPFEIVQYDAELSGPPTWYDTEVTHYDFCFKKCLELKCHYVEFQKLAESGDSWSCKLYGIIQTITDYLVSKIGSRLYKAVNQYADCDTWARSGFASSGVYEITINGKQREAYCQMEIGGWTVIQKRVDGSVDFNRNWNDYKNGFGDVQGEYWFGNDDIHALTSMPGSTMLIKISASSFENEQASVIFEGFKIEDEDNNYKLYSGTASYGDIAMGADFTKFDGMFFSTPDRDMDAAADKHCAEERQAGFWYKKCGSMSPNAQFYSQTTCQQEQAKIYWHLFKGSDYCLKTFEMAVKMLQRTFLCHDWYEAGHTTNGVYTITFNGKQREVYCKMSNTYRVGYTVIQKRVDGSVDFNRN